MIALDASVLIAHFRGADSHHETASSILRAGADEGVLIHSLNLSEVLVAAVRAGRGHEMRAEIDRLGVSVAQHDEAEPLRLAGLRVSSRLKLPDCCALDVALANSAALATFDDALAAAARTHHIPVLP